MCLTNQLFHCPFSVRFSKGILLIWLHYFMQRVEPGNVEELTESQGNVRDELSEKTIHC